MSDKLKKTLVTRSRVYANTSGKVVKSFVENYVRSDLSCHSAACKHCPVAESSKTLPAQSSNPRAPLYYVIPTCDALLYHYPIFALENCILTETLFVQLQERRLYYRLKSLLMEPDNHVVFFSSEHNQSTYVEWNEGESEYERNERAYRQVGRFYHEHLKGRVKMIVVTTRVEEKREREEKENGVNVMLIEEYLKFFQKFQNAKDPEEIKEILERIEKEKKEDPSKLQFPDHLDPSQCEKLRERGENVVRGLLKVNQFRFKEAFLKLDMERDFETLKKAVSKSDNEKLKKNAENIDKVDIKGELNRNRSIHHDEVYVRILPCDQWTDPENPEGIVIGFYKATHRERMFVVCTSVRENPKLENLTSRNVLCLPLDRRVPKMRLRTGQRAQLKDKRFLVRIVDWADNSRYPKCRYVRPLGLIGDLETEIKAILLESSLYDWSLPFSANVLQELPFENYQIPMEEIKRRRFFGAQSGVFICSIDPIGCTDIDDAISYQKKSNGTVEIGVHIADVAYYVRPDSEVDKEAQKRTTSIYMADRRLDMIPTRLSSNLCSLRMKQNRLTTSVVWTLNEKTMDIIDVWYGDSAIHSAYAFHYDQASDIMNGIPRKNKERIKYDYWEECEVLDKDIPVIRPKLDYMRRFAMKLRRERIAKGGLELSSLDKCEFELDDDGKPKKIIYHDSDEIHRVIEELMILANVYVAREIHKHYPTTALIRNHPLPRERQLQELNFFAKIKGFNILTYSNLALGKSLIQAIDVKDPFFNMLLRSFATKAMNVALYVTPRDNLSLSHYGLGLNIYTHFTSPIRRYADLLVHRILKSTFSTSKKNPYEKEALDRMCKHMNKIRSATKEVQRNSSSWYQALFVKKTPGVIGEAIVFKVTKKFLKVFIPDLRVNTVVFLTDREDNLYVPIDKRKKKKQWGTHEEEDIFDDEEETEVIGKEKIAIELAEDELSVTIKIENSKTVKFELFDHVLVGVDVKETRSHFPRIVLDIYSHEILKRGNSRHRDYKNYQQMIRKTIELKKIEDQGCGRTFKKERVLQGRKEFHGCDVSVVDVKDSSNEISNFERLCEEFQMTKLLNKKERFKAKLKQIQDLCEEEDRLCDFSTEEKGLIAKKVVYESKIQKIEKMIAEKESSLKKKRKNM